jgi:glucan 1,3-beta-glucosidase
MKAFAYLRHPIVLLAAVSAAIFFIWYVLGVSVQLPPSPLASGEKLGCVSYSPVSDDGAAEISRARIASDLGALAPYTSCIRTYRTGAGLDRVVEVARELGLTVLQGLAIGRDEATNRGEIERALALARTERPTIRAYIVGTNVLSRRELDSFRLASLIRQVREQTKLPVSYADRAEVWRDADRIAANVDFVTLLVPLYDAHFPVAATDAARHVTTVRADIAARVPGKSVALVEAGWPSAGRMRGAALPSSVNQARVLTELIAAAKAEKFQLNVVEGIDCGGRHWGLLHDNPRAVKFRWGGSVTNHPLWFFQAITGILLAFVVFAAGFLSTRSSGTPGASSIKWEPVAAIALAAGAFAGWSVADLAVQGVSPAGWIAGLIPLAFALLVPPLAAASIVRRAPFEGFSTVLDPIARRSAQPIVRATVFLLILTVLFAVQSALALAFDSAGREFPFAGMTGPAIAFLVLSLSSPPGTRRESYAEAGAAFALFVAALLVVVSETVLNWQAVWFALALCALAAACGRAPGAQRR